MNGRALRFYTVVCVFLSSPFFSIAVAQGVPGNGTVQGSYYFRYLGVDTSNGYAAVSAMGMLTFDGNGNYQVTGTKLVRGNARNYFPTSRHGRSLKEHSP